MAHGEGRQPPYARPAEPLAAGVMIGRCVKIVGRSAAGVVIEDGLSQRRFDKVLVACHADQALEVIKALTDAERHLLGAFRYSRNHAVLHGDERPMLGGVRPGRPGTISPPATGRPARRSPTG